MKRHSMNHTINRNTVILSLTLSTLCLVAYYSGFYFALRINSSMPKVSGLWAVISAIIVFEASYKKTIIASAHRIKGSILGATVTAITFSLFGIVFWSWFITCVIIVVLAHIIGMKDHIKLGLLTCALVYVIQTIQTTSPVWENCAQRCIESIIGIILAIGINSLYHCINKTE